MTDNETLSVVFLIVGCVVALGIFANLVIKLRGTRKDTGIAEALQALEQRFARVEVALDDVTTELHRVSEGQGSMTKLLSDRSRDASPIDRR